MSTCVQTIDFAPGSILILNQMLRKAGYVTGRMKPLSGPLSGQSNAVLKRFMSGVIRKEETDLPFGPEDISAFGRP